MLKPVHKWFGGSSQIKKARPQGPGFLRNLLFLFFLYDYLRLVFTLFSCFCSNLYRVNAKQRFGRICNQGKPFWQLYVANVEGLVDLETGNVYIKRFWEYGGQALYSDRTHVCLHHAAFANTNRCANAMNRNLKFSFLVHAYPR